MQARECGQRQLRTQIQSNRRIQSILLPLHQSRSVQGKRKRLTDFVDHLLRLVRRIHHQASKVARRVHFDDSPHPCTATVYPLLSTHCASTRQRRVSHSTACVSLSLVGFQSAALVRDDSHSRKCLWPHSLACKRADTSDLCGSSRF